jgi:GTPase
MVLVDERLKPRASWEFDADIAILTHSTTIQPRYQAVIHCEIIRQAARVVAMDRERLRWGWRERQCLLLRVLGGWMERGSVCCAVCLGSPHG